MEVEVFCVCDSVSLHGPKLSIRGIYGGLSGATFPAKCESPITLALRVRFEANEVGQHEMAVTIQNATGDLLAPPAVSRFDAEPDDSGLGYAWVNGMMEIPGVTFETSGVQFLSLSINEKQVARCVLAVSG